MQKSTYFDMIDRKGWPSPEVLEPFFLAPKGKEWSYAGGNDSWGLDADGMYGTEDRDRIDRVRVGIGMIGHPTHGVYLYYDKWDGRIRHKYSYHSKGDLDLIGDFVSSLHGDFLSVGLFVPFRTAWLAVRQFIETDGELPTSVEWIASQDLPPEAFPAR
jgi:hypothetical protein